jgi:hypothetical protein
MLVLCLKVVHDKWIKKVIRARRQQANGHECKVKRHQRGKNHENGKKG